MIEERTMELINDAMDGELSEAEQAELAGRLAQSEEARNYQTGMNELDVLLQELPNQPMPEELHRNIIHNIKLADRPTMRPLSRIGNWSGFVRYGFAAAAG
ncbi:MAG: hypothetical protein OES99_04365, partial [Gammaproteobacteria bacterium]|nr:hypothetical protein [Gammaproteobacteria bacterium]